MIKFNRPVVFFDLETTGTDVRKDRIVEISMMKVDYPNLNETNCGGDSRTRKINPGIPIPKQASDVHGITDEIVKDQPTFARIAKGVFEFMDGCDIIGYNSLNFDVPLLYNEFLRAGIDWDYRKVNFIDVCNIFKIKEQRTLSAAVKFYLNQEHTDAHGAEADVLATINVFEEQVNRYQMREMTPEELALFSNYDRPLLDVSGKFTMDAEGDIVFNFGQHKGKKAKSEPSYLSWMINKGDFSLDTLKIASQLL